MTRFQLRRLALQTTRRPELMPVLQDALLEHPVYGRQFEAAIGRANTAAQRYDREGNVLFVGVTFNVKRTYPSSPFGVSTFDIHDADWLNPYSWIRSLGRVGTVVVYAAPIPKH